MFTTLLVLTGGGGKLLHLRETSGSTYLCTNYSGCNAAGYSDSGYGKVSSKMYWRMYPGHNCVNYVAYRMIQAGMSTARPWTGSGNAANWGHAMERITNQTPAVGSVAWYDAYHHVGSAGHVAYVEKVNSSSDIIISEDSWSGTFHWQHLTKSGGFWPSGFIHFKDKSAGPVLANTVKPSIAGTPQVGQKLTASGGRWSGPPTSYRYTWTAGGAAISGATSATFVPTAAQIGKPIGVTITASHAGSTSVSAASAPTAAVRKGAFAMTVRPTLSGSPVVGSTLIGGHGAWATPAPSSYKWMWRADGALIPGATASRLTLTPAMIGKSITFVAGARRAGFTATNHPSVATAPVKGVMSVTRPYAVSGAHTPGSTLSVAGAVSPATATAAYQWMRDGRPIAGATASSYRLRAVDIGHRVRVRVILDAPNYVRSVQSAMAGVVRSTSLVTTSTRSTRAGVVVRVRVRAAGVHPVSGYVSVRVGRFHRRLRLVNGRAATTIKGLRSGTHPVAVHYWHTAGVTAGEATTSVRVN